MLALDMRILRALYVQKHLLRPPSLKLTLPPSLISFKLSPKPHNSGIHRQLHSTVHHRSSGWATSFPSPLNTDSENSKTENSPSTTVSTFYDPITGDIATHAGTGPAIAPATSNNEEDNPTLSSLHYESDKRSEPLTGYGNKARVFRGVVKTNQSLSDRYKKRKVKTEWVCTECGYSDGQWWGLCRSCKSVGTMKEFSIAESSVGGKISGFEASEHIVQSWVGPQSADADPVRLTDVNKGMLQSDWRIPLSGLFGTEVARVLGGGLVPGSLVLVGGDPGVGKSTLVLQIAAMIAEGYEICQPAPVVYVSGEESIEQIKNRADRMKIGTDELYLYSSTDIEDILDKSQRLSPRALIIDSIQTVFLKGVTGSAGSLSQVKECTSALLRFAKKTNIPVFLIGHVTKSGDIAGPRVLEHIVDAVLYMEGERYSSHRLLRSIKNRFGSTDELGVFDMSQTGLQAVLNPSEMFLGEQVGNSEVLAGLAVAVIMDGSRTFLIEIQALCVAGAQFSTQLNGIQAGKANMIIAVLMKQAGLKLQTNAVFLNVVSGVTLTETAGDLAVAAAICSSFLEFPIPNGVAFIGELGLGGELRMVPRMEKRVMTVVKLGYKKCIVPKSTEGSLSGVELKGLEIVACRNMKEVINTVFTMRR